MPLPPDIVDLLYHAKKTATNKSLAVPRADNPPDFKQVAAPVLNGVKLRHSIGVLCRTEEILNWPPSLAALDLLNLNEASLLEWQNFLGRHPYARTILHEAWAELATGRDTVPELVQFADLVTRMENVKHPFALGILAQPGVDS